MDQTTKKDLSPTIQTYQAVLNRIVREVELFAYIINREPSLEWVVPVISLKEGR